MLITIADVSVGRALLIGVGLAVACLAARRDAPAPWAYTVGWVLQVAAVAIGFLVPLMFVLGGIFALLWGMADFLGRKIERERAAAWAAYRAENPD